ncbi:hypothetical protein QWZ08_04600 [Ferruginibacter paludis]|uniref:hypothetical protein n=1 Tax=Ferruginibacter paludis TaxID=1310417 RepID=UPI0025B3F6D3|nr:hypothetical protein [Ferruginibacter paludis]MDN3654896.1 hypothetical protein [Ferruginibacter paludis]
MKNILHRITNWEAWPFGILYAPLSVFWLWYIIRSRAVWFFTSSNPKITFGGLEGEPKKEMYDLLPKELYPPTFFVSANEAISSVEQQLTTHNINFPFIVKPEVGEQGVLLRKINNQNELIHYHTLMPWDYIVQQLVQYPMEVSVFYIRHPKESRGVVTGFLHKIPLQVTGNGTDTLQRLVMQHPKGNKQLALLEAKHQKNWLQVIPEGERYLLSYAANHNRGARFVDLKHAIDDQLTALFDGISSTGNEFYYGRYDIMCSNVEDLKAGKNFTILEYNGCGAEPNHFYDTGYTLLGAYKEILKHWKALYQISKYNRQQGALPWSFSRGRKFLAASRKVGAERKALDLKIG